jgi:hypothetical protein
MTEGQAIPIVPLSFSMNKLLAGGRYAASTFYRSCWMLSPQLGNAASDMAAVAAGAYIVRYSGNDPNRYFIAPMEEALAAGKTESLGGLHDMIELRPSCPASSPASP